MDRNPYHHFIWFRQVLLDHFGNIEINGYPEFTPEECANWYMNWAIKNRFLHTFGNPDPLAGIIIRPVNPIQMEEIKRDPWGSLLLFDVSSDTLWIDFLHAPGNCPFIVDFVKKTGYTYVSWHNAKHDRYYKFPILSLPATTVFESERIDPDIPELEPLQL